MLLCRAIFNMRQKRIILLFFILLSFLKDGMAQNIFSDLRGTKKRADLYYSRLSYSKAMELYGQALLKKKNKKDYALNIKAATLFQKMARYQEAEACFHNIIASGYRLTSGDSIRYFNILKANGSIEVDTIFLKNFSKKKMNNLFRDSLYYEVAELPFNTGRSEYCPVSFSKGLLYVSDKEPTLMVQKNNSVNDGGFASIYYRERKDSGWSSPFEMNIPIENVLNTGPIAFYNQAQEAIINVCVKDKTKPYRLLLYKAKYDSSSKQWKDIQPMDFNDPSYSVGHPAITEDGKNIFFVSDRKGGYGGTDIYTSQFVEGRWTKPINMGARINTSGDEKYPYLSQDHVLFFSSDGRYGMGGMDIYYVDMDFKDTTVLNMGAPVNSTLDDFSFYYDEKIKTGYFSSNRKSKGKQDDLYSVKENKILLSFILKDDFDKKDIEGAQIQIWDTELNIQVKYFKGLQPNVMQAWIRPCHQYKIIIQKEDYRNDTIQISTYNREEYSKPISKIIYVKRKYIYYGNLRLRTKEVEGSTDTSFVIINNITNNSLDTIVAARPSLMLKLDAECEYIITSRNSDTLRYIYVEKKSIRSLDSKSFYNMYLSSTDPIVFRVIVKQCDGLNTEEQIHPIIKIVDKVNSNEFKISPGPDGDFQFIVTDLRLFDLYINGNKIVYSKQEVKSAGFCISFF